MSIDTMSKAVPASSPELRTSLEMRRGAREHVLVRLGLTDCRHDAFADARDHGFLRRSTDEPLEVGAHRDSGLDPQLDAVARDRIDRRPAAGRVGAVDDFRVNARADRVEHVASGEIDGSCALEAQVDVRARRRDQGVHDGAHVASREHVRLDLVDVHRDVRFRRGDEHVDDHLRVHFPQVHPDELDDGNGASGRHGL
jgi:hypothetical protein